MTVGEPSTAPVPSGPGPGSSGHGVLLQLAITNALASEAVDRALRARGIPTSQGALMVLIDRHAPITPTALTRIIALPSTTLRDRVNELVRAGHVRRVPHERDRRSSYLEPTESGRRWVGVVQPVVHALECELDQELAGQLGALAAALVRLGDLLHRRTEGDVPGDLPPADQRKQQG